MKRPIIAITAAFLVSCSASAQEVSGKESVEINTADGIYSIVDDPVEHKLRIRTSFGSGTEINVARAVDAYFASKGAYCQQVDRISMGTGYIQGTYIVSYICN